MCGATRSRLARVWALSLLLVLLLGRTALAAEADSTRSDSLPAPRAAFLRSALLPGWGQYYNGHPFKALFFASASTLALSLAIAEHRNLDTTPTPEAHEDRAARRNTRLLYFVLSVAFAAIDAYVDAQLADFDAGVKMEMRPGGALLKLSATLPGR